MIKVSLGVNACTRSVLLLISHYLLYTILYMYCTLTRFNASSPGLTHTLSGHKPPKATQKLSSTNSNVGIQELKSRERTTHQVTRMYTHIKLGLLITISTSSF